MPVILAIPGPTVRTRTIAEFSVREFSADRPAPTRTEAAVSRRSALGHWHGRKQARARLDAQNSAGDSESAIRRIGSSFSDFKLVVLNLLSLETARARHGASHRDW